MKHLFYLPAFLVFAAVSVHAQDTPATPGQSDPSQQSQGGFGQSQSQSQGQSQMTTEFSEADTDGDGYLSMEEAREALPPSVTISDTDGDGLLSQSEVQSALPNVTFEQSGDPASGEQSYIGEEEYDQIVQSIEQGGAEQGV